MATIIEVKDNAVDCLEHCVEMAQDHVRMAEHILTEIKEKMHEKDK